MFDESIHPKTDVNVALRTKLKWRKYDGKNEKMTAKIGKNRKLRHFIQVSVWVCNFSWVKWTANSQFIQNWDDGGDDDNDDDGGSWFENDNSSCLWDYSDIDRMREKKATIFSDSMVQLTKRRAHNLFDWKALNVILLTYCLMYVMRQRIHYWNESMPIHKWRQVPKKNLFMFTKRGLLFSNPFF